jgi:hypothetical protein
MGDDVARRARNFRDNGASAAGEPVEKGRFAYVGAADEHHRWKSLTIHLTA